uniref:Fe2OG dioxygenase domain-containing protein n=1 Tax=Salix viminalis TaxID=40686 RepID=A0A6N2LTI6_SALVM
MDSPLKFQEQSKGFSFESVFDEQAGFPKEFLWPDLVSAQQDLLEPPVDLEGFFEGDDEATKQAANIIKDACLSHGFFQVINHGVDPDIIRDAENYMDHFFMLPSPEKLKARRKPGSLCGYSGAHADRYATKLPLERDTLFSSILGKDFEETGMIYQKYCEAMMGLSFAILELLAISLGVDRKIYRKFFEDGYSILRCNFYPPCQEPGNTLGTGPHCDSNSITILHQDQVGGLEIFTDNVWQTIPPLKGALIINIGDTFTALSNGKYKSCLHRAMVNKHEQRKSLAFFLSPREDKVVRPPQELVCSAGKRMYPDFTWLNLSRFVQNHYRADDNTLQSFINWSQSVNT